MTQVTAMSVDEIDVRLPALRQQMDNITVNMTQLTDILTYKLLSGTGGAVQQELVGESLTRIRPVIDSFVALYKQRQLLDAVITSAEQLRKDISLLNRSTSLQKISDLLLGESIKLDPINIPLSKRSLGGGNLQDPGTTTVDRLLKDMESAYGPARDIVFAVQAIWHKYQGSMKTLSDQAQTVEKLAAELNEALPQELALGMASLSEFQTHFMQDPYGVQNDPSKDVALQIEQALDYLQLLKQERDRLPQALKDALNDIDNVDSIRAKSEEVLLECRAKITNPVASALPDEKRAGTLRKRLAILDAKFSQGDWRSVSIALRRWKGDLAALLSDEQSAFTRNSQLVERRKTTQGRLQAFEARATNHEFAEEAELQKLYNEIEPQLFSRGRADYAGCDLDKVEQLLSQYETRLRQLMQAQSPSVTPTS